jgi:drug/metabolite transporter (DMT)-like permease
MLLGTILLWALNVTATRYLLTHGFRPLAYATIRYFAATSLFWAFTWQRERSFRIRLSDAKLVGLAALLIFLNQVCFVTSVHLTTASTVGLVLGTTPVFVGVIALLAGFERPARTFWLAAVISFLGVGLIAGGDPGSRRLSGDVLGDLIALATAATWAAYSVAIAPLMRRYSPSRISSVVLALGWVGIALSGIGQTRAQDYALGWRIWSLLVFATLGPLVLTNVLWFRSLHRIGPSRATLAANLQPFVAAVFALVLLSETITAIQVAGGVCIGAGILAARRAPTTPAPPPE